MEKKTTLIIVLTIVFLSLFLYFVPIKSILSRIPIINRFYNNTSIEINTQNGKAKIWINNKEYGETPATIEDLPEGKYTVELEKIASGETFYKKQSFPIELSKNTVARIDVEIGPENILNGSVLFYTQTPNMSSNEGLITITSSAEDAKIYIDKEFVKRAPLNGINMKDNQYQVKVTATGYEDIEIPVFVRKGYHLNLKTYHFPIPVTFDNVNNTNE